MIESRKEDHMDICLNEDVEIEEDYWGMIKFFHKAAPEVDFDEINLGTEFLEEEIDAPIMISAITGGHGEAGEINRRLAAAAEEVQIPMSVGSQRAALDNEDLRDSYEVVKEHDPPLVFGNIGAPQLIEQENEPPFTIEDGRKALEMIDGDYLAVHFNYLQEAVQPEGDHRAAGLLESFSKFADSLPIIAKETGAGIAGSMAKEFIDRGAEAVDVGGMGGTSFSAVEEHRIEDRYDKMLAQDLQDWGIPTPVSILECRKQMNAPLISTGGIRSGVNAAKALALGADVAGIAGGILPAVYEGKEETVRYLKYIIKGLRSTMFLLGRENLEQLRQEKVLLTGELRDRI